MKKVAKIVAIIVVIIPLLIFGWLWYSTEVNLASPTQEALAALLSDENVLVESDDWLVLRPETSEPIAGLIFYPGANCDIRGYISILRAVAEQGYLVVAVSMPFDFSIFAPNRADDVRTAYPDIQRWAIAGHSMGGAMAAMYASGHQEDLAGLILWDSYPPTTNSLEDSKLPVVHIHRATEDGLPPPKFESMRRLFPKNSQWVAIPGGQHMYFGSFNGGGYQEDQLPGITREAQQDIITAATLDGLATMVQP